MPVPTQRGAGSTPEILAIIRAAADRHGVPRQVALAFSWVESRHNPRAQGDLHWHTRLNGSLYRIHVLENKRFESNTWRLQPELWHSYGLFQLLACYHCRDDECPDELLDPARNADRGCAAIARQLERANGDPRGARLAYVGCGIDGSRCDPKTVARIETALKVALQRFQNEEVPRAPD